MNSCAECKFPFRFVASPPGSARKTRRNKLGHLSLGTRGIKNSFSRSFKPNVMFIVIFTGPIKFGYISIKIFPKFPYSWVIDNFNISLRILFSLPFILQPKSRVLCQVLRVPASWKSLVVVEINIPLLKMLITEGSRTYYGRNHPSFFMKAQNCCWSLMAFRKNPKNSLSPPWVLGAKLLKR